MDQYTLTMRPIAKQDLGATEGSQTSEWVRIKTQVSVIVSGTRVQAWFYVTFSRI
jgi:hypothetical protein